MPRCFMPTQKAYMAATQNVIDQEKMAVIIQEVVGRSVGIIISRHSPEWVVR